MPVRYRIEYVGLLVFLGLCKCLPPAIASRLSGGLARLIGPRLGANKKAVRHLRQALRCEAGEAEHIALGMWDNLGRTLAEYPHLETLAAHKVEIRGLEHIEALRDDGKPGILFGAHLGNWEIIPHALLHHAGFAMHPVYRAPNNPHVDRLLHHYRSPDGRLVPYPKSRSGMVGMVRALKGGEHLGLLIDQKYNEGITASFFGLPARTGTAFIELAQKHDCPLVPGRCIRQEDGFLIEILPPLPTFNRTVEDILADAHAILEKWINEHPEQWLWLHRRWREEKQDERET